MHLLQPQLHSRRAFLQRSTALAAAGSALPFALNLAAIGEAAAFTASDYKALVCVFLYGGNDYANTVVTYDDDSYNKYAAIRGGAGQAGGGIAIAKADLAATLLNPTTPLAGGRQYALHPAMTGLAGLFNAGQAAVQLNVGPLAEPITKAEYNARTKRIPPKLFSHNDQQSVWQSSSPEGSTIGWGGNLGDIALANNSNSLFTCMSVAGNAVMLSGDQALSYQVSTGGAVGINAVKGNPYGSSAVRSALNGIVQQASGHVLENEYNRVTKRAIDSEAALTAGINGVTVNTVFPAGNGLADQLKMVARLIGARSTLGTKRQVFFVSMGGFDLHDNLIANQATLMGRLSAALTAFHAATQELGVANAVTTFTASDFGRTLNSNGDGSDHGWGSHHLLVGGAVRGKAFYGSAPPVANGNGTTGEDAWQVGQGRLLPTTSVDQYAATLARWFGATDAELPGVLPAIGRFGGSAYPVNLGFLG